MATGYWLLASKKKCYRLLATGVRLKNINNEQ